MPWSWRWILPADATNPPNGQTWETFGNNYTIYLADITAQLNAQSPDGFTPTITILDTLISSIAIQP